MKPNSNSVEVHPQLSNKRHPVDGALVDDGLLWPLSVGFIKSWRFAVVEKVTTYSMGVLHPTHPMQQASSKWTCQTTSCHDAKCQTLEHYLTHSNDRESSYVRSFTFKDLLCC
jgi:hypothetical protein